MAEILPNALTQFVDSNGKPLAGGSVYFYIPNTTTKKDTYQDSAQTILNTNPVILDANGQASIWGTGSYRQVVFDSLGNQIWDQITQNPNTSVENDLAQFEANLASSTGAALIGGGSQVVNSIAALRNLSKTSASKEALVTGYYASGDGGGGEYYLDAADTTSTDNGGTIIVATDGGRWKLAYRKSVRLEQFGAKGDGSTDDTTAINNAISAVGGIAEIHASGGANYKITSSIQIGNGSASAPSTSNSIAIIGISAGATSSEVTSAGASVKFTWAGAASGTMVQISGPIYGLHLSGLTFDCASIANTAIQFNHPFNSKFEEILALNYKGTAYVLTAYPTPTGTVIGASHNKFSNVHAKAPAAAGSGLAIGAASGAAGQLDVARNVFIGCDWWRDGTNAATYSLALQFVDNCTFIECHTYGKGGSSGLGLYVNPPTGLTTFPEEIAFFNCPIEGGANSPGTWTTTRGIGFFPYPTGDSEPIPSTSILGQYYGYTDKGEVFGGLVVGSGNARISVHNSATASLTFGSITGQGSSEQSVTVNGAALGDIVIASCGTTPAPGFVLTAFVNGANSVAVRWLNITAASTAPVSGAQTYRVDLWKH